jgi:beta-mannosidase
MSVPYGPNYFKSFVSLILLLCSIVTFASVNLELNLEWTLIQQEGNMQCEGTLPGNVFLDLHNAGLIPDPLVTDNASKVQWVSENNWIYRSQSFSFSQDVLDQAHVELHLEAVDTYAEVYLNGVLIQTCNNAFRIWKMEIAPHLQPYENVLEIHLSSANAKGKELLEQQAHPLPGEAIRAVTRKPQFQYGWDWAPKLNTMGVHRPLKIRAWNDLIIRDISCETISIENGKAILDVTVTFELNGNSAPIHNAVLTDESGKVAGFFRPEELKKGVNTTHWKIEIDDPKLWWTHDLGEPHLYTLTWKMNTTADKDVAEIKTGIRTIELITEPDAIGETFFFELNGHSTYMRGANWVPTHVFDSETQNHRKLLEDCAASHMNMIRVWGGAWYEKDVFYDSCDELGILVWQDFMFACAMYPGDEAFLENVKTEAEDQLHRLRNHPSIALWCGNNENSEGWARWGWKDGLTPKKIKQLEKSYAAVFKKLLPKCVVELDDVAYWESSPMLGRGDPDYVNRGDAHNWCVWHDAAPFENYQEQVPRFMSEFGFQSFPDPSVWVGALREEDLDTNAVEFRAHQKHPKGFALISQYIDLDFPLPTNFTELTYLSQLNQARGVCMGIEAQRTSDRYCMGSLFWQLNDCWPSISWSSIDFKGTWKALQYALKEEYNPIYLSTKQLGDSLFMYVVNDSREPIIGTLKLEIFNFDGKRLGIYGTTATKTLKSNEMLEEWVLPEEWNNDYSMDEIYTQLTFEMPEGERSVIQTLGSPKDLKLTPQEIQQEIIWKKDHFEVTLLANHFHVNVWLNSQMTGKWTDNFFHLIPGETKTVSFYPEQDNSLMQLQVLSLNTFY